MPDNLGPEEKVTPEKMYAAIQATRETLLETTEKLDSVEAKGDNTRWGVVVIGFLGILFGFFMLWKEAESNREQNTRFEEFAFCQAEYNRINVTVSKTRVELNARENKNTRELITKIGQMVQSQDGNLNSVFERYNREIARIDKLRAENPPIAYPDCYNKYIKAEGLGSTLPTAALR